MRGVEECPAARPLRRASLALHRDEEHRSVFAGQPLVLDFEPGIDVILLQLGPGEHADERDEPQHSPDRDDEPERAGTHP